MNRKSDAEWQAWHDLCKALLEAGAVTAADLLSHTGRRDTVGQRLLQTIRDWGEARAAVEKGEA